MTTQKRFVFTGLIFGSCFWLSGLEPERSRLSSLSSPPSYKFKIAKSALMQRTRLGTTMVLDGSFPPLAWTGGFLELPSFRDSSLQPSPWSDYPRPYRSAGHYEWRSGLSPPV